MKLFFLLIAFLCINQSFVLSESRLESAQRNVQNDPRKPVLNQYLDLLRYTARETFYECYNPNYNWKLFNPLERPAIDVATEYLVSRLF